MLLLLVENIWYRWREWRERTHDEYMGREWRA